MDTSLVFGLGVASAIVVILIIALVVATLMLMSKVAKNEKALRAAENNIQEAFRQITAKVGEVDRRIDSESTNVYAAMAKTREESIAASKSYTDSRIDRMSVSK